MLIQATPINTLVAEKSTSLREGLWWSNSTPASTKVDSILSIFPTLMPHPSAHKHDTPRRKTAHTRASSTCSISSHSNKCFTIFSLHRQEYCYCNNRSKMTSKTEDNGLKDVMVNSFYIQEEATHKNKAFHIWFLESDQEDRIGEKKKQKTHTHNWMNLPWISPPVHGIDLSQMPPQRPSSPHLNSANGVNVCCDLSRIKMRQKGRPSKCVLMWPEWTPSKTKWKPVTDYEWFFLPETG